MNASSRFLALVAIGGTMALAACGGSDLSPVASTTAFTSDSGSVTTSGNGPGAPPSPAPSPGTGTCTNDCDGTGQGPGPGSGNGPGNGPGNGSGNGPANGNGPGNGYGPGPGPSDGFCGNACTGAVGPDPGDIATLLVEALQEEYKAQMLYRSVLETFGAETAPFALIERAEARHVEALQMLFERRQMAAPASAWSPSRFGAFDSVPLACAAGVAAEREDAAFYTPYLQRTDLPQDVRNVLTNLQKASLENHLPAFERCR